MIIKMLFITFLTQFRNSSSIAEVLGQFPGDHSPLFLFGCLDLHSSHIFSNSQGDRLLTTP